LKAFLFLLIVPFVGLVFMILNIFKIIAPGCMFKLATTKILSQIHLNEWKNSSNLTKMSDLQFLFSFAMYKWFVVKGLEDKLKYSTLGASAPDAKVYDVLSKKTVDLLSLAKTGRPLVLNFGSCS